MKKLLSVMNRRIAYLFDRDHTIGHAYFCGVTTFDELESCLLQKVIPLLQEYFFDDWSKIQLVFGDRQAKPPSLHVVRRLEDEAGELFGSDSEIGSGRVTYRVAEALSPEMLKAIYE